ncbi:MAG: DUF2188 domain-containing protein [Spirochaetales bacterium]|nr:DUF2188 domain-containing protein [Spirochaetales bacterium]
MSNQTIVQYDKEAGDWEVTHPGAERASGRFSTKADAEARAREISRNQGTELVIKNMDGKIGRKDSHGNDPRNIPG